MNHMLACCSFRSTLFFFFAAGVEAVGVLDRDEALGGFSSAGQRTSTALNHPSAVSHSFKPKGIFPRVKTHFWPPECCRGRGIVT